MMVETPIFHVNGDDPEAVVFAARVATEYRQTFGKDVVLDLICYRRYGHNEGDDPTFTQPIMYRIIKGLPPVKVLYEQRLFAEGVLTPAEAEARPVPTRVQRTRLRGRLWPAAIHIPAKAVTSTTSAIRGLLSST